MFIFFLGAFTTHPDIQEIDSQKPYSQEADLTNAILLLEDLPPGFQDMPENQKESMGSMLELWQSQSSEAGNLDVLNFTGFWTGDAQNLQYVISGLITPLSPAYQTLIDQAFARPEEVIGQLQGMVRGEEAALLTGVENLGDSRLAFSTVIGAGSLTMHLDYIVARRGPVLVEVAYIYLNDLEALVDAIEIARTLDDRVAAVVGREIGVVFRPEGPLVPKLTTYIPTPLDVSTRPAVIGTNLLLAALLMLPFAAAAEIFTRTLGEHEIILRDRVKAISWFHKLQEKLKQIAGSRLSPRAALRDWLQFLAVVLFYGLVFSLLDRTWKPFSLQGVVLFISMTIAYGLVGIADDLIQWRAIRRWELSADLTVRPTNALLAVLSTTVSRLFTIVPGLMFGSPEVLNVDEEVFDQTQQNKLLKISARTFLGIGLGSWLLTVITTILQRLSLGEAASNSIGGLEAFLLVIFAVTLENLFVQMLGFPGGFGQKLKQKKRWVWLVCLIVVTFVFYHTLINPRGELAQALQTANVQLFFGVVIGFVILAFGLNFFLNQQKRKPERVAEPQPQRIEVASPVVTAPVVIPSPREIPSTSVYLSLDEPKLCPVCANSIKAEARICRFCRATFAVTLRGYCLNDHDVVEVVDENRCSRCQGEVADLHVESLLINAPAGWSADLPIPLKPPEMQSNTDTRICPVCGQTIKAEAKICRFCRTMLS